MLLCWMARINGHAHERNTGQGYGKNRKLALWSVPKHGYVSKKWPCGSRSAQIVALASVWILFDCWTSWPSFPLNVAHDGFMSRRGQDADKANGWWTGSVGSDLWYLISGLMADWGSMSFLQVENRHSRANCFFVCMMLFPLTMSGMPCNCSSR